MKEQLQYVALLRGIMPMNPNMRSEKLREAFEKMGFTNVHTVIGSGNVVFASAEKDASKLEKIIEVGLPKLLGFTSSTIVWSQARVKSFLDKNPFLPSDIHKPNVTFFKQPPDAAKLPKGTKLFTPYGLVEGAFCYTVDTTRMKTPEAMITLEKEFGKTITTRTWGTIEKIAKKMAMA